MQVPSPSDFPESASPQEPDLSDVITECEESAIRQASIIFAARKKLDPTINKIDVSMGNISRPMPPPMLKRWQEVLSPEGPFKGGVMGYTPTKGLEAPHKGAEEAFRKYFEANGFGTEGWDFLTTAGGTQAFLLFAKATCGKIHGKDRPLLVFNPIYGPYIELAKLHGINMVAVNRTLQENGKFTMPETDEIQAAIRKHKPGAMLIIPYDNPSGAFLNQQAINELAKLCVEHNMWLGSDEAYFGLNYNGEPASSLFGTKEKDVPGVTGRLVLLASASKLFNYCGGRIGGLFTNSQKAYKKIHAAATNFLCPNAEAQYVVGSLADLTDEELRALNREQKGYYQPMMTRTTTEMNKAMPNVDYTKADASFYGVADFRKRVGQWFDSLDFVNFSAREGDVETSEGRKTLITASLKGFYHGVPEDQNPGRTQIRIAYVRPPEEMVQVSRLLPELLKQYEAQHAK